MGLLALAHGDHSRLQPRVCRECVCVVGSHECVVMCYSSNRELTQTSSRTLFTCALRLWVLRHHLGNVDYFLFCLSHSQPSSEAQLAGSLSFWEPCFHIGLIVKASAARGGSAPTGSPWGLGHRFTSVQLKVLYAVSLVCSTPAAWDEPGHVSVRTQKRGPVSCSLLCLRPPPCCLLGMTPGLLMRKTMFLLGS